MLGCQLNELQEEFGPTQKENVKSRSNLSRTLDQKVDLKQFELDYSTPSSSICPVIRDVHHICITVAMDTGPYRERF